MMEQSSVNRLAISALAGLALVLSSTSARAELCDPINCGKRSTGQEISATIEFDFGRVLGEFYVYRKTSSTGTPTLETRLHKTQKIFKVKMPSGTGKEYRWHYVPVELSATGAVISRGAASEEILILRK